MTEKKKHAGGRPTGYNVELAKIICVRLAEGESLRAITCDEAMPCISAVYGWLHEHEEFMKQYRHARDAQIDTYADEIIDIADDGTNDYVVRMGKDGKDYETVNHEHINRSRLRCDNRKWIAERMKPKKYGAKQEITHTGDKNNPIVIKDSMTKDELIDAIMSDLMGHNDGKDSPE